MDYNNINNQKEKHTIFEPKKARVSSDVPLNIRQSEFISSKAVGLLLPDETVSIISEPSNGWSKIKCEDGFIGYVLHKYLTILGDA